MIYMQQNLNLLLVEEDLSQQQRMINDLATIGIKNVVTAKSSKSAQHQIVQNKFHLAILDAELGGCEIDGIEFGRKVSKEHQLPILYLSNNGDEKTILRLRKIPNAEYLLKNAPVAQIQGSIQRLFTRHLLGVNSESPISLMNSNFFLIKTAKRHLQRVNKLSLLYLEADSGGTIFYTSSGMYFVYITLQAAIQRLSCLNMIRIHKKFAIPLHSIETTSEELIGLGDGKHLPIGRLYRPNIQQLVNALRVN